MKVMKKRWRRDMGRDDLSMMYAGDYALKRKSGDIGFDLRARGFSIINSKGREVKTVGDYFVLKPGCTVKVDSSIRMCFPEGVYGLVVPRSGLSFKGIDCKTGLVDTNYRGSIGVILHNSSNEVYRIELNDRIGQLILERDYPWELINVDNNQIGDDTNRGSKGFGSSGR